MTDCEKVLQILKEAGSKGIHSFDLMTRANTPRAAIRIQDLKDQGHKITSTPEKHISGAVGCRYFLNDAPKPVYKYIYEGNVARRVQIA